MAKSSQRKHLLVRGPDFQREVYLCPKCTTLLEAGEQFEPCLRDQRKLATATMRLDYKHLLLGPVAD